MQVQLTPEAKIAADFLYIRAIFAVVGFVSALRPSRAKAGRAFFCVPRLKATDVAEFTQAWYNA